MALLTTADIEQVRQAYVKDLGAAGFTKPVINAAIQAVEDVLTSPAVQNALSNAINTATSPLVLTAQQKRLLVRWVLKSRFDRGNN